MSRLVFSRKPARFAAARLAGTLNFTRADWNVPQPMVITSVNDAIDEGAMRVDYIVVRHKQSGTPSLIAKNTRASVINAKRDVAALQQEIEHG